MRISIIDGNMNEDGNGFSQFIDELATQLKTKHELSLYTLSKYKLNYCTGCWTCWWKTPGRCVIKDDGEQIFHSVINSDLVILASPLMAGFTSSLLKKIVDRFIVLLHPYIIVKDGECHHRKRYDAYPKFGLLLAKEADTDDEDIEIVNDIFDRFAINFHSERLFTKFIDNTKVEGIVHELGNY